MSARISAGNTKMRKAAMLLGQGHTPEEAAELVGKPEKTIQAWKLKPEFAAMCQEECNKWLLELKPRALVFLQELLAADDKKLGVNAANLILRYSAQQESSGSAQITVKFTGGMPEPGMPVKDKEAEEEDEEMEES